MVLEHEEKIGKVEANVWSQAYSEMIEMLAEDSLRVMAPPLLGGSTTIYTEEDLERAYGAGVRRSDVAIDFSPTMCLFEIQKLVHSNSSLASLLWTAMGLMERCAGINRHEGGDGRALHRRGSDPRWPRAMRPRSRGRRRSVGQGYVQAGY
jgi:hypothetical protein